MRRLLQIAAVHTLLRKSKQTYYDKYFEVNCNNSESTLKGQIPNFVKDCRFWYILLIMVILKPITNAFKNYFSYIAETTKN